MEASSLPPPHFYTSTSSNGILPTGVRIGNARDGLTQSFRAVTLKAMPDTGAWTLIINEEIRQKLGLTILKPVKSSLADGSTTEYGLTEPVDIRWKDRDICLR